MLPANLLNALKAYAVAVEQKPLPIPATDAASKGLQLELGQRLQGNVQAQVAPGVFKVNVAGQPIQMQLPANIRSGDTVALQVISIQPRLTFGMVNSANPLSTPEQLGSAARLLSSMSQQAPEKAYVRAAQSAPIWEKPQSTEIKQLSGLLREALSNSGLFYESHQAQWMEGTRSTAQLLHEPQNMAPEQVKAAMASNPSEKTVVADNTAGRTVTAGGAAEKTTVVSDASGKAVVGGDTAGKTTVISDASGKAVMVGDTAGKATTAGDASGKAAMVGDLAEKATTAGDAIGKAVMVGDAAVKTTTAGDVSGSAVMTGDTAGKIVTDYNAAGKAVMVEDTSGKTTTAGEATGKTTMMGDTANQSVTTSNSANASVSNQPNTTLMQESKALGIPDHLQPLVQQQLNALETRQMVWQGIIWPEQTMQWEVHEQPSPTPNAEEQRQWVTELRLDLPNLGEVAVTLRFNSAGLSLTLNARTPETRAMLGNASTQLVAAMSDIGIPVLSTQVTTI